MIRLRLFGPPDLRSADDADASRIASKTLALLARLAVASPDTVRRDHLTGLLWPELDEARARNALSKALHQIRRVLGEDALATRGNEEIALSRARWSCDVWAFDEALATGRPDDALALRERGELLDGVHIADAQAFEPWLDGVRERLRSRLLKALLARAAALEREGDLGDAVNVLSKAGEVAPDDEVLVRRRMAMLDAMGDRAGAHRLFEQFAERLQREMELEPAPETSALAAAIAQRREASPPGRERPVDAPSPREHSPASRQPTATDVKLVERSATTRGPTRSPWIRWSMALGTAAVVGVALLARRDPVGPPVGVGNRVLVAPFANRTGDTMLDVLGEMVADFVAQGIQRTDLLEVVDPLTSVMATAPAPGRSSVGDSTTRALAAAERAGAAILVSGAFYRKGDSLLFQADVIDVPKRRRLTVVEPVMTGAADHVAIATRVREATAGALATIFDAMLVSTGATQAPAPSLAAYREFRRGLELFPMNPEGALPYFLAAARLDSTFTQALIWAAFVHGNAGRAAQHDSLIAMLALRRDRLQGLDRHAVTYLMSQSEGRHDDALRAALAAAELSPGSQWNHNASNQLLARNRLEGALAQSRRVDAEHGWARGWFPYWKNLTNALHLLGRHEEELDEILRAQRLSDDPGLVGYEIRALIGMGRVTTAEQRLDSLTGNTAVTPFLVAVIRSTGQELRAHGHADAAHRAVAQTDSLVARVPLLPGWSAIATAEWRKLARASSRYEDGQLDDAAALVKELDTRQLPPLLAASASSLRERIGASQQHAPERWQVAMVGKNVPSSRRSVYAEAQLAAIVGDTASAMRLLRSMLADGSDRPDAVIWLHRDREWDALRTTPAFRALVAPR